MKIKIGLALVLGSMVASTVLNAQSTPAGALLALSKKDHTLAIVDPATLQVVAKVPIGNDPHEVIASSDGKTAYVSNYGFGAFNTLAVVDLVGQKALSAVVLGPLRGPHGLDFVGESLRDSRGRSAEQRFSRGVFFLDTQCANQLVPLH